MIMFHSSKDFLNLFSSDPWKENVTVLARILKLVPKFVHLTGHYCNLNIGDSAVPNTSLTVLKVAVLLNGTHTRNVYVSTEVGVRGYPGK